MPTALDNMMKSKVRPQTVKDQQSEDSAFQQHELTRPVKNMVWAFGLVVAAATAKVIWGDEMFPPEKDPKGDPKTWTREEMRRWLAAVGYFPAGSEGWIANLGGQRNLFPQDTDTKDDLLERVLANMRQKKP
ncbi:hypothetical protein AK830_g7740 [Neonectria ditissima]|uniref:STE24 endopeptidase n=1 Tax=Neonectria ditissima TaxID=78410 RepID=A0A0P7AWD1_9HYPO|nr:hypothetical protein AK830_g7740 [Neonectria ditissima]